eukprot:scaffold195679_cov29-Tisochrysis_lutea.AAC.5
MTAVKALGSKEEAREGRVRSEADDSRAHAARGLVRAQMKAREEKQKGRGKTAGAPYGPARPWPPASPRQRG